MVHDFTLILNKFQPFGQYASKLANTFKDSDYTLNSVEAFYLQVTRENGNPALLDMAMMFLNKYEKDGFLKHEESKESDALPQYFVDLKFKLLLTKFSLSGDEAKYNDAMKYLCDNKATYGIEADFDRIKVHSLLHKKHVLKNVSDAWYKEILTETLNMAKKNYLNREQEF